MEFFKSVNGQKRRIIDLTLPRLDSIFLGYYSQGSIVCLMDRWIWISVSSVLHFVCSTFFLLLLPLPPALLPFSSAHYLPNLLPHMQTMCNESLSYLFSTNNSNSDMISILHILEATHDNSENQYVILALEFHILKT